MNEWSQLIHRVCRSSVLFSIFLSLGKNYTVGLRAKLLSQFNEQTKHCCACILADVLNE